MDEVIVFKTQLFEKLRENRDKHRAIFKDALEGWKQRVLEELEVCVKLAKTGTKYITSVNLPMPIDHTEEYDTVIAMVEWSVDEKIELTRGEFEQYVLNNWMWMPDFISTSTSYSSSSSISS